ncbi:IclR family transcriptional regulator [Pseudomonas sp. MAFF 302030]|jgi:IclR family acetate operon transcriptional repressor|uniref:IclR family transcriptional regulator n=1 Tax=Pseudomonas morbosilactucae TaxID=2938197 RepID=A0A9X1Z0I1_9PSED|nr:IclR family transcriptional regulator [Pseudomonas morbosilactucae]MCK9801555.1 IclR family transcriptional regulator [Pseudomonas morbosilactucae]WEK11934.1 MAG: IclR family transcriptional regulator [Pseudomonas sp.]
MASAASTTEAGFSGVLDRGLAILELLAGSAEGLTLSAVSDQLRIPRSATHRLLTALGEHAYVRQEQERGTYVLTSKLQVLAFRQLCASGLVDAVQPVLNRLAAQAGELVRLAVADPRQLTWVARAQGARNGLRYDPDMGMEARLSCSATGFAWLACLDDEQALARVEHQGYGSVAEFGPHAPQTPEQLLAQLAATRQRGYAVAVQTFSDWMAAIAVALRHPVSHQPIGVISIAGPVFRFSEAKLHEVAPLLLAAAAEVQTLIPGSPALMSPELTAQSVREGLVS